MPKSQDSMALRYLIAIALTTSLLIGIPARSHAMPDAPAQPAVRIKVVAPRYPAKAVETGQEGWVALSFIVTPEGTTSSIRVEAEKPRHVFTRSAFNAVAKWVYTPRQENRTPVPQSNSNVVLGFALSERHVIRDPLRAQFSAAEDALQSGPPDAAATAIETLDNTEGLTLFEMAAIEHLRGRLAFKRRDFATAADSFARVLQMGKFATDQRTLLVDQVLVAAVNSGDRARVLAAVERWPPTPREQNRELRVALELFRVAEERPVGLRELPQPSGASQAIIKY